MGSWGPSQHLLEDTGKPRNPVSRDIWGPSQHLLEDTGKPRNPVLRWPVTGPTRCLLTASRQCGSHRLIFIVEAVFSVRYGLDVCNFDSRPVTAGAPVLPRASPCDQLALGQFPHSVPRQKLRLSRFADAPCPSSSSWHS